MFPHCSGDARNKKSKLKGGESKASCPPRDPAGPKNHTQCREDDEYEKKRLSLHPLNWNGFLIT